MKLRSRLLLTVLLTSLPLTAGLAYLTYINQREATVAAIAESTVQQMEASGIDRCLALRERPFGRRRRRALARRRRMFRARQVYTSQYEPAITGMRPIDPALRAALEAQPDAPYVERWLGGSRVRVAVRIPEGDPCALVVLTRNVSPAVTGEGLWTALVLAIVVNGLTALLALVALGPVVRRLRILAADVRRSAAEGYGGEVTVTGRDEVAELARAFNEAAAEVRDRVEAIERRDDALRDFLARTTHDVMVPLTVLQGHLAGLRQRADGPPDPALLGGALQESDYIASLLRNLSAATRLEAGEPQITRHETDLRAVVERAVGRHRPIAREAQVSLNHALPDGPVPVWADSTLAEQAVSNLVQNAIRYNRPGGHVAVVLHIGAGAFGLRVEDDGPGIPPQELARVTEGRFRGGSARQRRPEGLGLGLGIVRDVCASHGWELHFASPPQGGLRVSIAGSLHGEGDGGRADRGTA